MARDAGASGLLVMPPHYWLRFGMQPEHVIDHFSAIGKAAQINLVIHVYPAWTKASYSSSLLADLVKLPTSPRSRSERGRCPSTIGIWRRFARRS